MDKNANLNDDKDQKKFDLAESVIQENNQDELYEQYNLTNSSKIANKTGLPKSTTFFESKNVGAIIPCEKLYIKFEGNNPTGTQKDRIANVICDYAKKNNYSGITTASCGNFGAALSLASNRCNLDQCEVYIPKTYHLSKNRRDLMRSNNASIKFIDGTYEDAVLMSSENAEQKAYFDANPGTKETTQLTLLGYSNIAFEIYKSLKKNPHYLLCPVGNGSTLAGIHFGFKKLLDEKKITELPKLIAAGTKRGNPIIKCYKQNKKIIEDLKPEDIHETKITEPLINWHAFDGQLALNAIYESKGFADYVSDTMMIKYSKILSEQEGIFAHPASSSPIAVLAKATSNKIPLKGTFIVVITSRAI